MSFLTLILAAITATIVVGRTLWVATPPLLRWIRRRTLFSVRGPKIISVGTGEFLLNLDVGFWWSPIIQNIKVGFVGSIGEDVPSTTARVENAVDCVNPPKPPLYAPGVGNHGVFEYTQGFVMRRNPGIAMAVEYQIPGEWSGKVQLTFQVSHGGRAPVWYRENVSISAAELGQATT